MAHSRPVVMSVIALLRGVIKHWWAVGVGLLAQALSLLAEAFELEVPRWLFWSFLGVGLAIAVMFAYHDVRVERDHVVAGRNELRQAIEQSAQNHYGR